MKRYQFEASRLGRNFARLCAVTDTQSLDAEGRPIAVFQTDNPENAERHRDQANRVYSNRAKAKPKPLQI
jgi:hypothetical protein